MLHEGAKPFVCPARRIPEALGAMVKQELQLMEDNGIISKVTQWVNALVCIEKTNKRTFKHMHRLNDGIKRPHYPTKTIKNITAKLSG